MILNLTALDNFRGIRVEYEYNGEQRSLSADNGDELVEKLDRVFKDDKLDIDNVEVRAQCRKQASDTSCRVVKTVQSAFCIAEQFTV